MNKCRLEGPLLKAACGVLYVSLLLFGTVGLVVPTSANAAAQLIGFTVGQAVAPLSATPIVASLPARDTTSDKVGATIAQFRVDEGGSATYSIPIQVSPGTAGMVPKLALNYSSRTATGVMGPGWSLGGLSQIARCRQTRENGPDLTLTLSLRTGRDVLCLARGEVESRDAGDRLASDLRRLKIRPYLAELNHVF